MSDISDLDKRIEGAFTSVRDRIKQEQQQHLKAFQERQQAMKEYEAVRTKIVDAVRPRLQALAKRAGDRATITPTVAASRTSVRFEFRSAKAHITLSFSVSPDREAKNATVEYDLKIVPVLWKFESHGEISTPVASPDIAALTRWLDDRIVAFVELYVHIHESEIYDKAEYVEDPIAQVRFPKFAAGATLDHGGQSYFFVDESTRAEFARQKGIAST